MEEPGAWAGADVGLVLLIGIPIEFLTGLLFSCAYNPRLGNDPNPDHGLLGFYTGHLYGVWAFMAGFAIHICVKFGEMVRALRSRRFRTGLRTGQHVFGAYARAPLTIR